MGKINISFNNKNFNIDESILSEAKAALKEHLLSTMNGTGATVVFDGVTYNIDYTKLLAAEEAFANYLDTISGEAPEEERLEGDGSEYYTLAPTALSFRSTAPLNELQEVRINGVTVDPANYTLEEGSTIVTFPIEYLKTLGVGNYEVNIASESKSVKGNFTVSAPEMNEHGFYYNQPYSAFVQYPFNDYVAFIAHENGIMDTLIIGGDTENCTYTISDSNITVSSATMGTFNGIISADGTEIYVTELATTFKLGDEYLTSDEDYLYIYNDTLSGYEVHAIDKTKASYQAIKTGVNNKSTVKLADYMFYPGTDSVGNNLLAIPEMPSSIASISNSAFRKCTSLVSVTVPDSITSISTYAFLSCHSLVSVTIPDSVTSIGAGAFSECVNLLNIVFEGTMEQWNTIDKYLDGSFDWNGLTPATHVHCIDGDVAL